MYKYDIVPKVESNLESFPPMNAPLDLAGDLFILDLTVWSVLFLLRIVFQQQKLKINVSHIYLNNMHAELAVLLLLGVRPERHMHIPGSKFQEARSLSVRTCGKLSNE